MGILAERGAQLYDRPLGSGALHSFSTAAPVHRSLDGAAVARIMVAQAIPAAVRQIGIAAA